jgi:hypothetical protein
MRRNCHRHLAAVSRSKMQTWPSSFPSERRARKEKNRGKSFSGEPSGINRWEVTKFLRLFFRRARAPTITELEQARRRFTPFAAKLEAQIPDFPIPSIVLCIQTQLHYMRRSICPNIILVCDRLHLLTSSTKKWAKVEVIYIERYKIWK